MVVVMIVAFVVAWTPYALFSFIVTVHPTIYLDPIMAAVPAFFAKTAAVYNPIIYVFMNKQVWKKLNIFNFYDILNVLYRIILNRFKVGYKSNYTTALINSRI